ncbi:MAG: hypothetical protein QF909_14940, partial [SAR202 cluster bacterium]|nr:hypothetical protein [SAR202 cluster bacterium]
MPPAFRIDDPSTLHSWMGPQPCIEVIYERIPLHISELRQKAEALVRECCDQTRFDTLGRHYLDPLQLF